MNRKAALPVLYIAAAAIIIQFTTFKFFYPYASFIHGDSRTYIEMAYQNAAISVHMTGYSKFLRLFSAFTSSDTALVAFQYLMIQSSALFFLYTLFYFYKAGKWVQILLLCFMVLNPLFLHLANLISSDGLFLALSLTWFSLLLWIIHRPGVNLILWHTLVLSIVFTVRYNAIVYPAVATLVFLGSRQPARNKIVGIGACLTLCGLFVWHTGNQYKALTGAWQYAPFSGWLMANNAMYAYRHVDSAQRKPVPEKFRVLDNMIRAHFDSTSDVKKVTEEMFLAPVIGSTAYMWSPKLPLFKYREYLFRNDTAATELKKWASMGPLYREYGTYIIRQYPSQYIQHFAAPAAVRYFAPPVEFLSDYNSGYLDVWPVAQQWFGYKSTRVVTRTKDLQVRILNFYPVFSGIINIVMTFGLIGFALLNGFRVGGPFRKGVLLAASIWLLNAAFTIFSAPASLRFQAFPILLTASFVMLLVDWLWRLSVSEKSASSLLEKKVESESPQTKGSLSYEDIAQ